MLDSFFNSIEKTFVNFTFRRLLFLITIFAIGIIGIYVFESYTKYGFYYRMEKKAALLEQMHELKMKGVDDDPQLADLYDKVITELEKSNTDPELLLEPYQFLKTDNGIKLLSSIFIPFLMVLAGFVSVEKEEYKSFTTGLIIYTLICIAFGVITPTLNQIWINGAINLVFSLILLGILIKYFGNNN